jgi:nicotinic acid mononucleotide adenylyltransferase
MAEQLSINALSNTYPEGERQGTAIVMGGTFAPIHRGHFDAMHAASEALVDRGLLVEAVVFMPNSKEYVQRKLPASHHEWPYERRVQGILDKDPHPHIPTYVDDISGRTSELRDINAYAPSTIRRHLGFGALQLYLAVGSDQLLSLEPHLEDEMNQAICVLRPDNLDELQERLEIPWVAEAVASGRFIITEREDMQHDVSSTELRRSVSNGLMTLR